MSFENPPKLRHTLAFRLTLWYAGIFTLAGRPADAVRASDQRRKAQYPQKPRATAMKAPSAKNSATEGCEPR